MSKNECKEEVVVQPYDVHGPIQHLRKERKGWYRVIRNHMFTEFGCMQPYLLLASMPAHIKQEWITQEKRLFRKFFYSPVLDKQHVHRMYDACHELLHDPFDY